MPTPHFDDQAQLYADGELREVLFYREDIEAYLECKYISSICVSKT